MAQRAGGSSNIRAIVAYFKGYYGWILAAATAIPGFHALINSQAVLPQQRAFLGILTPLICAAVVGYCIFARDSLVRVIYVDAQTPAIEIPLSVRIAPAVLLVLAVLSGWGYLYYFDIAQAEAPFARSGADAQGVVALPHSILLVGLYVGFFAALEAAFSIFIIKEYVQDALKITDRDLIGRNARSSQSRPRE